MDATLPSTLVAQAQALAAAHPVVYSGLCALAGALGWHQALTWLETNGVDKAVAWIRNRQRLAAKRLGFTDAQVLAAEQAEAAEALKIAQRVAADLAVPLAPAAAAVPPAGPPTT